MKFCYAPRRNVAYFKFQTRQTDVESIQVSDELVVDMTPDGKIFGIELLNANEQLTSEGPRFLEVVNGSPGQRTEFPLAS